MLRELITENCIGCNRRNTADVVTGVQIFNADCELTEKLAALVPPPRLNLVRYHGILAPNAGARRLVVPGR